MKRLSTVDREKSVTHGFTLIELLIVIAIILILIAIALPNFIEAQIRAKVTRAEADMRSLGIALESYLSDYDQYPADGDDFEIFDPTQFAVRERLRVLTTPVKYIAEIPSDPFHQEVIEFGGGELLLFPGPPPYPYSYNTPRSYFGDPTYGLEANGGKPRSYGLTSFGPDLNFDSVTAGGALFYSPTNGTLSKGDIIRLVGSGHPIARTSTNP